MTGAIPFSAAEQTIHGRFDDIASTMPDMPAVSDSEHSMTFSQLMLASNKMANIILGIFGPGRGNIGVYSENNIFQVIAILGILKSGRSYLPLDTSFPPGRNRAFVEDAGCRMIICSQKDEAAARDISADAILVAADNMEPGLPESPPQVVTQASENAITLYTSGSTGKPKGVLQSHRNMVHFIRRMSEAHPIYPSDKTGYFLSFGFSGHALPLLGALLNGSELVAYHFRSGNFWEFSSWLKQSNISFTMMIPSFLRHFLAVQEKKSSFPDMRMVFFGGESLYRNDIEKARKVFGKKVIMVNIYASTEAYLMRSYTIRHDTIIKSNIVPIGYPVDGMELSIVGEDGEDTKAYQAGNIMLRSEYVTEGYHNNPGLQEKDFKTDPLNERIRIFNTSDMGYFMEDGCMVHLGRRDAVVKLRGQRIDLGEVVNYLLQGNDVKEATCALKADPNGNEHLVGYIVPVEGGRIDEEYHKALLIRMLPDYMIPSHILFIDQLPKNEVGKIDTEALPGPAWDKDRSAEKQAAENETEEKLVGIFEKTLKISPIGTNENFLRLGANSLNLFVALSEVEKQFDIKIDIKTAIETPDIRSLAGYILKNK